MIPLLRGLRKVIRAAGIDVVRYKPINRYPDDFEEHFLELMDRVRPYTITSPERIYALLKAVDYLVTNGIKGDIVECGVYRGGSMMAVAGRLAQLEETGRDMWLYDTFEGMTAPTEVDVDWRYACRRPLRSDFHWKWGIGLVPVNLTRS